MSNVKSLIIVGDSAFAQIAREYFDDEGKYLVKAFSVEKNFLTKDNLNDLPVVAFEELVNIYPPDSHEVFVAITYTQLNRLRTRLVEESVAKGYSLASYISPSAFVWKNVKFGEHCFIFEGNVIQPFVTLGKNIILWSGNHVGHHTIVKDNCFISSQVVISGYCEIGENSFIGVNSTISNNIVVGIDNWIGPGALISSNTPSGALLQAEGTPTSRVPSTRFFRVKV